MKILPITPVVSQCNNGRTPNFRGIAETISSKVVSEYSDHEQGSYTEYEDIVEYRPYKNETHQEIQAKVKELSEPKFSAGKYGGYASAWESLTKVKVVIGKRLDCTKEAAEMVLKHCR